ncbi:MAG TPA: tRNA (N6-threonylcarbamoyladenosine(37)-N6)-methyltransferase TrmO [Methanoregulaceae archaeon]|nr:tRNA (N6-threonylcarbamoyladenosine(37)-N6)-methyltransferase TrmO [Methanoregulaceae archaeon]
MSEEEMPEGIRYIPIGAIHSPWRAGEGMPIQPCSAVGVRGSVTIFREYLPGLKDLDGFSRIYLIYDFHRSHGFDLEVTPFLDSVRRGIFSTRAPRRPNHIGISIVRLVGITEYGLDIEDVDIIDGTPLLDIKPYVPEFDCYPRETSGWLTDKNFVKEMKADRRFIVRD